MDPDKVYEEVLARERERGTDEEVAVARAEAAAERARLGSPHPDQPRFWVSEQPPPARGDGAVETAESSRPLTAQEADAVPTQPAPSWSSDQALAPGAATQPAADLRSGDGASMQLHRAEERPEDDVALQSQWDNEARMQERRRLMAEQAAEVNELADTGVPLVAAVDAVRPPSVGPLLLYVLVPVAAILIFIFGFSHGGGGPAPKAAGGGAPANTLTHVTVTAKNVAFDTKKITVAADKQVTIHFVNQDPSSVQHNIAVYDSPKAAKTIYKGKVIPGGSDIDYTFKTPKPGTYFFRCDIHPTSMTGTFVVK